MVQRLALAGMLWSKQLYQLRCSGMAEGRRRQSRRRRKAVSTAAMPIGCHVRNEDIISMPDKWEYPWYASWDLAFQSPAARDGRSRTTRKSKLLLMVTHDNYMHPNGQLPAYEYAFGDANPPLQAWAAFRVYHDGPGDHGASATIDLPQAHALTSSRSTFTWWVNRQRCRCGRNIFQGGFLGLDNIGIFDRSKPLSRWAGTLSQSDATAWMAMYALNLMRMAIETRDG